MSVSLNFVPSHLRSSRYQIQIIFIRLLAQPPLQTGKRLHWRKGVDREMCVGYPCASLATQSEPSLTKLNRCNDTIFFCIIFLHTVYPCFKTTKILMAFLYKVLWLLFLCLFCSCWPLLFCNNGCSILVSSFGCLAQVCQHTLAARHTCAKYKNLLFCKSLLAPVRVSINVLCRKPLVYLFHTDDLIG
jgi:hypothetical protein